MAQRRPKAAILGSRICPPQTRSLVDEPAGRLPPDKSPGLLKQASSKTRAPILVPPPIQAQLCSARVFSSSFRTLAVGFEVAPTPKEQSRDASTTQIPAGGGLLQSQALRGVRGRGAAAQLSPADQRTHILVAKASTSLRRPASTTELIWPQGRLAQAKLLPLTPCSASRRSGRDVRPGPSSGWHQKS